MKKLITVLVILFIFSSCTTEQKLSNLLDCFERFSQWSYYSDRGFDLQFQIYKSERNNFRYATYDSRFYKKNEEGFRVPNSSGRLVVGKDNKGQIIMNFISDLVDDVTADPKKPQFVLYEGSITIQNAVNSTITENFKLKLSLDFDKANLNNSGDLKIRELKSGVYTFMEGTLLGLSFSPTTEYVTIFNLDGSEFGTLNRIEDENYAYQKRRNVFKDAHIKVPDDIWRTKPQQLEVQFNNPSGDVFSLMFKKGTCEQE